MSLGEGERQADKGCSDEQQRKEMEGQQPGAIQGQAKFEKPVLKHISPSPARVGMQDTRSEQSGGISSGTRNWADAPSDEELSPLSSPNNKSSATRGTSQPIRSPAPARSYVLVPNTAAVDAHAVPVTQQPLMHALPLEQAQLDGRLGLPVEAGVHASVGFHGAAYAYQQQQQSQLMAGLAAHQSTFLGQSVPHQSGEYATSAASAYALQAPQQQWGTQWHEPTHSYPSSDPYIENYHTGVQPQHGQPHNPGMYPGDSTYWQQNHSEHQLQQAHMTSQGEVHNQQSFQDRDTSSSYPRSEIGGADADCNRQYQFEQQQQPPSAQHFGQHKHKDSPPQAAQPSEQPEQSSTGSGMVKNRVQFRYGRRGDYASNTILPADTYVIVEGDRGEDLGVVIESSKWTSNQMDRQSGTVLRVIRQATSREVYYARKELMDIEQSAISTAQQIVNRKQIPIRIVQAEHQFDQKKLTFYFTSDMAHPIFREALSECFAVWKCRIWFSRYNPRTATFGRDPACTDLIPSGWDRSAPPPPPPVPNTDPSWEPRTDSVAVARDAPHWRSDAAPPMRRRSGGAGTDTWRRRSGRRQAMSP